MKNDLTTFIRACINTHDNFDKILLWENSIRPGVGHFNDIVYENYEFYLKYISDAKQIKERGIQP